MQWILDTVILFAAVFFGVPLILGLVAFAILSLEDDVIMAIERQKRLRERRRRR